MARKFPSSFPPMRIGAIVSHGARLCEGACGPKHQGQELHKQPNYKFTLLLFLTVMESAPPGLDDFHRQFIGGPRTPPVNVPFIRTEQAKPPLISLIGWN